MAGSIHLESEESERHHQPKKNVVVSVDDAYMIEKCQQAVCLEMGPGLWVKIIQAWVDELRLESSFKCRNPLYELDGKFDWQTHFFCGCCQPVFTLPWYLVLVLVTTILSYIVYETTCRVPISNLRHVSLKVCWEARYELGPRFPGCWLLLNQLFIALELEQRFDREGPQYDGPTDLVFSFDSNSTPGYLYQFCVDIPQSNDITDELQGEHLICSEIRLLIA